MNLPFIISTVHHYKIIEQCAALSKSFQPLANELLNISFCSLWDELFPSEAFITAESIPLISGLEMALQSSQIPVRLTNTLLNLAEFMEMLDKPLPLDIQLLARRAAYVNTFAKCLHYREIEFNSENVKPSTECVESLITVNNKLGLLDAAAGILQLVRSKFTHIAVKPLWLEKLSQWEEARQAYMTQISHWSTEHVGEVPPAHEGWMQNELGMLRCLHALGEYEELAEGANTLKQYMTVDDQVEKYGSWVTEVCRLGANAAWMLGRWDSMEDFVEGETLGLLPASQLLTSGIGVGGGGGGDGDLSLLRLLTRLRFTGDGSPSNIDIVQLLAAAAGASSLGDEAADMMAAVSVLDAELAGMRHREGGRAGATQSTAGAEGQPGGQPPEKQAEVVTTRQAATRAAFTHALVWDSLSLGDAAGDAAFEALMEANR